MSTDVADILERAADLIEPQGRWTRGEFARGKSGKPVTTRAASTCFCAIGAIGFAAGRRPPMGHSAAEVFLERVITGNSIPIWNDAHGRTQAEVVAKLREAAKLAREAA